jgi:hypothetical protein
VIVLPATTALAVAFSAILGVSDRSFQTFSPRFDHLYKSANRLNLCGFSGRYLDSTGGISGGSQEGENGQVRGQEGYFGYFVSSAERQISFPKYTSLWAAQP